MLEEFLAWWKKLDGAAQVALIGVLISAAGGIVFALARLVVFAINRRDIARDDEQKKQIERLISALENNLRKESSLPPDKVQHEIEQLKETVVSLEKALTEKAAADSHAKKALVAFEKGDFTEAKNLYQADYQRSGTAAAEAAFRLGQIAQLEFRYTEALASTQDAVRLAPENVDYALQLSAILLTLGQYDRARLLLEPVLEKISLSDSRRSNILNNIGGAWDALGEHSKAIGFYEKALAIEESALRPDFPIIAILHNNIGSGWKALGEFNKAIEFYEKALKINENVFGPDHPLVAILLNNIGSAWGALGENHKAIDLYIKGLAMDEKALGPDHPNIATRLNNIGNALQKMGEHSKALVYFEKALAIIEAALLPEHSHVAIILNNIGTTWMYLGEPEKAADYFARALAIFERTLPPTHEQVIKTRKHLEIARRGTGKM